MSDKFWKLADVTISAARTLSKLPYESSYVIVVVGDRKWKKGKACRVCKKAHDTYVQTEETFRFKKKKKKKNRFANCKAIVPSNLLTELHNTKLQCSSGVRLYCSEVLVVADKKKVLCITSNLCDPDIIYVGCDGGEVLQMSLSSRCKIKSENRKKSSYKELPFCQVYPVTHIICCKLRERGIAVPEMFVITGSVDKSIRLLNLTRDRMYRVFNDSTAAISSMCVWGGQFISSSRDGSVTVWDLARGTSAGLFPAIYRKTKSGTLDKVTHVHAAGQVLTVGYNSGAIGIFVSQNLHCFGVPTARLCFILLEALPVRRDIPTCSTRYAVWENDTYLRGHLGSVSCVRLKDDMSTLFTGGDDCYLMKWKLQSRERVWRVKAHASTITCITSVTNRLITASSDGLVKLWDEEAGCQLSSVSQHCCGIVSMLCVMMSSGKSNCPVLVTTAGDDELFIWKIKTTS